MDRRTGCEFTTLSRHVGKLALALVSSWAIDISYILGENMNQCCIMLVPFKDAAVLYVIAFCHSIEYHRVVWSLSRN